MSHGRVPGSGRIVLVGFMAAGKSTVGRRLAARLGWRFVDFDDEVRRRTGRSAAALIREQGESRLREEEARLTTELGGCRATVLAPGGGWITQPGVVGRLGAGTTVVWLRLTAEEAVRRVEAAPGDPDRPLLGPPEGRLKRAASLLRAREPRYAAADVVVDVEGKEPDAVVEEIVRRLGLQREKHER